jgi:dUTP pyrophosphatase
MVTVFRNYTKSLVTSSAKIAKTAFSFGLSFLPGSPSATQTSRSTGPYETELGPDEADEAAYNGGLDSVDPYESVLGGNGLGVVDEPAAEPAEASEPPSRLVSRMEELRFTRLSEAATLPTRAHDSDAGLDLYAAEGARVGPGQRVSVGTGLAVAVPEGLAGLVLPRSGLALKHGVTLVNSPGLIDPGYRGEVRVVLLNTDGTAEFKLAAGDRVAQLILVPIAHASPNEADSLESTARGESGFGSTG